MFDNTLKLVNRVSGAAVVTATAIIDGPSNRKTTRGDATGNSQLSIAHQESNENPGFTTLRSVVRIGTSLEVADTDKTVKGYVQLTTSVPKDVMTVAQLQALVAQLINFLKSQENSSGTVIPYDDDAWVAVPRLYAGEP